MTTPYEMNRRAFMKSTAAVTATAAVAPTARARDAPADGLIHRSERGGMPYLKLGRTNFMCSRLVFGGGAALMGGKAVRLLNAAFDAGVNFYDLGSNVFYKGSERAFAPFLAAHRVGPTTPTRATTSLAASVDPTDARKGTGSGVSRQRTAATPPNATGLMAVVPVLLFSDNCH